MNEQSQKETSSALGNAEIAPEETAAEGRRSLHVAPADAPLTREQTEYWPVDWRLLSEVTIGKSDDGKFSTMVEAYADAGWFLTLERRTAAVPTSDQAVYASARMQELTAFLNGRLATPNGALADQVIRLKERVAELEGEMLKSIIFDGEESWQRFVPPAIREIWEQLTHDARRQLYEQATKLDGIAASDAGADVMLAEAFPVTF